MCEDYKKVRLNHKNITGENYAKIFHHNLSGFTV